jgi:hypothetical protein
MLNEVILDLEKVQVKIALAKAGLAPDHYFDRLAWEIAKHAIDGALEALRKVVLHYSKPHSPQAPVTLDPHQPSL